jgi:hypothetical protein
VPNENVACITAAAGIRRWKKTGRVSHLAQALRNEQESEFLNTKSASQRHRRPAPPRWQKHCETRSKSSVLLLMGAKSSVLFLMGTKSSVLLVLCTLAVELRNSGRHKQIQSAGVPGQSGIDLNAIIPAASQVD